jgi:outer membrane lipase/esterase
MFTRRRWHFSALASAALVVAACGGGDNSVDGPLAERVVVFGDSLSDLGTYTPATSINGPGTGAPYFGGKFTTNSHTGYSALNNTSNANLWVEWIAARLGVVITPAMAGFGPDTPQTRVRCPVRLSAPALAGSCTGYAQGGSRVTSPAGIGNPNGTGLNGASPTPITLPMVTQVADHLSAFGKFGGGDIVFVFGGNNDVFTQFGAVGLGLPQDTALENLVTAATELATLVKEEIIAKGGKRVVVMTLPDSSATPFGASLGPVGVPAADGARQLLAGMSAQFNTALLAGLQGSSAKIIDARALSAATQANYLTLGLTNITTPACAATPFNATATSLLCNAAPAAQFAAAGVPNLNGLAAGASASTYLFADGVHPTTGGHRIFADQIWSALKGFGWVPANL